MFPAIAPQMRRRKVRLGAGSAPRLALANDRLLGSSKAHHEWVDRPLLAVLAVQVMKSTRGCPTAACDPNATFAQEQILGLP